MAYLQYRDQRVSLTSADQEIGAFDGAALRIPGNDPTARAVVRLAADGTGIVTRGFADAVVSVNGIPLGAEPSPLLHGDRVELGGHQLHYGDDAKGGSTQVISTARLAEQVKAVSAPSRKPTSATGGRLVSLVDGREYAVGDAGVTIGREVGNDIVVASTEVSRRHAQIAPGTDGYTLSDLSTNGVLVNGMRITQRQVLGRGDVIRIGGEEFRFYADKPKEPSASAPTPAPAGGSTAMAAPTPDVVPPAIRGTSAAPEAWRVDEPPTLPTPVPSVEGNPPLVVESAIAAATAVPVPPSPRIVAATQSATPGETAASASLRTALATLEVINEGPIKGTTFTIFTPLTNIGRGAHNDIQIGNDSVSDSHAKILRKESHWFVVDQGSTNGTYVGGRRVTGEQQLIGAPDVRFGDIKLTFRNAAGGKDEGGSTRAIAALNPEALRRLASQQKPSGTVAPSPAVRGPAPAKKRENDVVEPGAEVPVKEKGCAAVIVFVLTLGATGVGMLVLMLSVTG